MVDVRRWLGIAAVAAVALGAQAAETGTRNDGSRSIDLKESVMALGVKVRPGAYTLRWNREVGSESVRVELTHGRTVVASGRGAWVVCEARAPYEALVYDTRSGTRELSEIKFRNSTDSIRLETVTARLGAPGQEGPGARIQ